MTTQQSAPEWIWSTLASDPDLTALVPGGIHEGPAPSSAAFPHITFSLQSASDTVAVGAARVVSLETWQVRVVGRDLPASALAAAADRADLLLNGGSGPNVAGCVRGSSIRFATVDGGVTYRMLGGLYRLTVTN